MNHSSQKPVVALVQMRCSSNPDQNLSHAVAQVREAGRSGAGLVCLPELFRTHYPCQREDTASFDTAEPIPGPTTEALSQVAQEVGAVVIAPIFERRAAGLYHNSAVIIDVDGTIAGKYRKMHIPDDPGYYEKFYFTPGDLGFVVTNTRFGRVAVLICWDQWFPEAARLAALRGADILFYPTAIGWHPAEKLQFGPAQRDAWRTVQRGHAIANGVFVAAVNRVGHEGPDDGGAGIEFWGSSFLCDPQGIVLAEAAADSEQLLLAEMDSQHIEAVRRNWPFLRDRRTDAYAGLSERYLDQQ